MILTLSSYLLYLACKCFNEVELLGRQVDALVAFSNVDSCSGTGHCEVESSESYHS